MIINENKINEVKAVNLGNGSKAYRYGGKAYLVDKNGNKKEISDVQYNKLVGNSSSSKSGTTTSRSSNKPSSTKKVSSKKVVSDLFKSSGFPTKGKFWEHPDGSVDYSGTLKGFSGKKALDNVKNSLDSGKFGDFTVVGDPKTSTEDSGGQYKVSSVAYKVVDKSRNISGTIRLDYDERKGGPGEDYYRLNMDIDKN